MNKKALKPRVPYTAEQIEVCDNRIRRTCHSKQRHAVFDLAKRVSIRVGRGGGKTAAMLLRLIRRMVRTPDANCLFIASTRQSAERLVWRDLKRIVGTEGLRLSSPDFSEADLTLELPNGSRLTLFGCDDKRDIQKLRGITYHEVAIDEVASIASSLLEELLLEVIGPRMVGAITLGGTPGKILAGLFYEATRPGSDQHRPYEDRDLPEYEGWDKWSSHHWSIEDGVSEGIAAMIELNIVQLAEKARQGWSDSNPYWLRERKAEWAADLTTNVYAYRARLDDGAPWNEWKPEILSNGFAKLPGPIDEWGFGIGIDVGFKDAFALEVFAFSYSDPSRALWHVYEVYRKRLYAKAIAQLLIGEHLDHAHYGGIIGAIGWPVAMVGDFAGAGGALLAELAEVYGINIEAADKPYRYKDNAIELTNSDLYDGRMKIMAGSALANEMQTLQWIVDPFGKRAENKAQANHACDATIYIRNRLAVLLPSASTTPPPQPQAVVRGVPPPEMPTYRDANDDSALLTPGDFTGDDWWG